MLAAKHTDMIVGLDMHMIQPPPPAPPMMVPHPVVGMIMDPSDYSPGACTVYVNGLPRARAGSMCMMSPPHIPIGGMFVKPPLSEVEVYQGSSTVTADGDALSAGNHQVLGCHDIGAPAPVRAWKSGGAKSLMKAGSVVIAIPGGAPVMVGGSPTTSASGDDVSGVALETVGVETVSDTGEALAGVFYELELEDGTIRSGCTGVDGTAWASVPAGKCTIRVTSAANSVSCASGRAVTGGRSMRFVAGPRDDVYTIAARCAIGDRWQDVYEHAENDALRETRADPWELLRGDLVTIPADLLLAFEVDTGLLHRLEVSPAKVAVNIRLLHSHGAPFADCEVVALASALDAELTARTDDDGVVTLELPLDIERLDVAVVARVLDDGTKLYERFRFAVGQLDPSGSTSGRLGRLRNLGFCRNSGRIAEHRIACMGHRQGTVSGSFESTLDALVRKREGGAH